MQGKIERQILKFDGIEAIVGVDEVGRGCIAGPVYAACVALDYKKLWKLRKSQRKFIRDSKLLSHSQRQKILPLIYAIANEAYVASSETHEVESLGILKACFLAMHRCLSQCKKTYQLLLIDGNQRLPDYAGEQRAIVEGDRLCYAIAAASIIAKTSRDAFMHEQAKKFPGYGFESHVGYGTKMHRDRLKQLGLCELHRKTFAPVKEIMGTFQAAPKLVELAGQDNG